MTLARIRNETLGQVFAFILTLVVLVGSIWLISIGKSIEGVAAIVASLATLAGVFVYGRMSQRAELLEKRQALVGPKQ